ncbi:hypothetical protein DIPPA_51215 [Diplonema papillatum]|nr:hypothetical protein DIPPA_63639 [Diplonema papillatum]KAJ9441694.1 hypothetical protein DIPPA_60551 [Diplonema papillatum]KAJ9453669.1 hypothetical protein DIPPA_50446 [Diplonema papillatum]KAJ9470254.1 hypothetical protein DIPPA_51215 [Diplonema papillatum]
MRDESEFLSLFARTLGRATTSEAAVERHFKTLSAVIGKLRAKLSVENVNASLTLAINHRLLNSELYPESNQEVRAEKRTQRAQATLATALRTGPTDEPSIPSPGPTCSDSLDTESQDETLDGLNEVDLEASEALVAETRSTTLTEVLQLDIPGIPESDTDSENDECIRSLF